MTGRRGRRRRRVRDGRERRVGRGKVSGRAGGVLLASRPWRLPRWTTHIVASRTKKREETRRKERSRSTGRSEMKGRGKTKRTEEKGGKRRERLLLDRFDVPSIVRCVHQPNLFLSSFLPSFLPSFLRFFFSFFFLGFRSFRPSAS